MAFLITGISTNTEEIFVILCKNAYLLSADVLGFHSLPTVIPSIVGMV
jgi:hypothetical protein